MQLIQDIKTFLKEVIDIRATIDTQKADRKFDTLKSENS